MYLNKMSIHRPRKHVCFIWSLILGDLYVAFKVVFTFEIETIMIFFFILVVGYADNSLLKAPIVSELAY